ncbi:intraflagellar transport protein 74 homolog [Lampris incognitus]|uniref:intraflagellar transport protein 74 homolog n=1 Tax=Lampris incognitus TaxID=2546036 RepID=UPI0024B5F71E|nr:intraflagellar transport protein 74 homolog [Lampris incognitus]
MANQRPLSSLGRQVSRGGPQVPGAGRPTTAVRPPPTPMRVVTGTVPGTGGRPGTGRAGPVGNTGVLSAQIKVTDRPVTQQGLIGMKTGMKGPQRQILDKSYYLGLLRSKITELATETSKLHKEMDNFNQENSVYLSYEKRAEGLAGEIRDLQGQLADYNMLVDKLNTNTEMEEVMNDFSILKAQNDRETESMDVIFTERQEREEAIRAIEDEIEKERCIADDVVKAMSPARREKYMAMMKVNKELIQELSVCQEELDALLTRKDTYEVVLAQSQMKQEAVRLHEMLSTLEARRNAMEAEERSLGSPQQERDKLFRQVKDDNQEIASMERQLVEIRDRSSQIAEEIQRLEHNSEEAHGECSQKYKELKKKEEEIDRFLESFEETMAQEQGRTVHSQSSIVSLLEHSSRNMTRLSQVATVTASELRSMQEVLLNKETEVVQSQTTARGLSTESQRLQQDLEKVEQLEGKINGELSALKERITTMDAALCTYRDLEALKSVGEDKKKRLQQDRVSLSQHRDSLRQLLQDLNHNYEVLKSKLHENETHAQLANLERKWQHLEQNNYVMKEFIASKAQESDYSAVSKTVTQQLADYNKSLTNALQNNRS